MKKIVKWMISAAIKIALLFQKHNYIILESANYFYDNTLSLYKYLKKNHPNFRIKYIISNQKQYDCRHYYIEKKESIFIERKIDKFLLYHFYLPLTKYIFFSYFCHYFKGTKLNSQTKIIYLKHYEFLLKNGENYYNGLFTGDLPKVYVTESTTECANLMMKKYDILAKQNIIIAGMPRNDEMFLNNLSKEEFLKTIKYHQENNDIKILLCMCTFRNAYKSDAIFFRDEFPLSLDEEQLIEMDNELIKNNELLIIKTHHAQKTDNTLPNNIKRIVFLDNNFMQKNGLLLHGIYPLIDAMITDYSSAYISYLELDRMIGFLLSDEEIYRKNRGFTIDNIESIMPGPKLKTFDEFKFFLANVDQNKDSWAAERRRIKKMLLGEYGCNNCKSVCDIIMNENKNEKKNSI